MEDLFAYHRQKAISKKTDLIYCEGGSDFLFLGFDAIRFLMNWMIHNKQYKMSKAVTYLNSPPKMEEFDPNGKGKYISSFYDSFKYFTTEEMLGFGIKPLEHIIKCQSASEFMSSFFDLGYHIVYKERTKLFGDHFGVTAYSPFYNDPDFVNFCLTIPMEMKYCLGHKKHILKQSFEINSGLVKNFEKKLYDYIRQEVLRLSDKYLKDKTKKIFKYLPFDEVQKYTDATTKKTIVLLNLAIWLEVNE